MLEEYIYHGKQRLRCGYTTGSCAAAASKAVTEMLITGREVSAVSLMTPKGIVLNLDILNCRMTSESVSCAVKKDSGDDPDITNGILVYASAEKIPSGIEIDGGEGIGRVTKSGLDQPIGAAAINSVPRRMITAAVTEICEKYDYYGGIRIIISVPDGEKIAKKTYNPRMGIEGGISIIGTTGIVEPMSNSALIETIRTEMKMRRSEGIKNLLLTIGNYSENFLAREIPDILDKGVKCSNFIGDAIDIALEYGFESVLIIGHIGKLVKLGAGIMNTHSAQADGRMDVLVTCGVLADVDIDILKKIPSCVTVDAALNILDECGAREKTTEILMQRAEYYLDAKVKGEMKTGVVMFSDKYGIIGKTSLADRLISTITEEYNG
jgi:cobalt-precorrin-5B (C1)-methyltransferase